MSIANATEAVSFRPFGQVPEPHERRPLRILEFRAAEGSGGGPEKTILMGTARTDRRRFEITVCYIRDHRDVNTAIATRAREIGVDDYVEIRQRGALDREVWRVSRRLVRERAFDIVHAHDYKTDLLALWLARRENIVPLATAHGWCGTHRRERFFYYPIDRRLLARFPQVIAVSGQIRDELIRHGSRPEGVRTVLNGIDERAFHRDRRREVAIRAALGIRPGEIVIGSLGRVEPIKRFDSLVEAFAVLRKHRPQLRLLVAGDGSQRVPLERKAAAFGLGETCRFLGYFADVAELHHTFDVFVQTSDYEGTPNVVLEAMAMETPIVATDSGGTGEIMHDGLHGLLIPLRDRDAIVRAIEKTLSQPEQTAQRVAAARRRVENELSFATRMATVEAIYEELAERFHIRTMPKEAR